LIFALHEHPGGVTTEEGLAVVYDVERNAANVGRIRLERPALVWRLGESTLVTDCYKGGKRALSVEVELDRTIPWIVRCDRIDFPPGGIAYRHVHPGPGIRRILHGELTIDRAEGAHTYRTGEAWFEDADDPVLATASPTDDTAFVRVMLLPAEWAGRRTIRHLDPADDERPKLQRATILLEAPLDL
jgi:hypothetical protein